MTPTPRRKVLHCLQGLSPGPIILCTLSTRDQGLDYTERRGKAQGTGGLAQSLPQEVPSLHLRVLEPVNGHRHVGREDVTDVGVAIVLGEQVHIVEGDTVPVLLLHGLPEPHAVKLAPVEGGVVHLGWTEMLGAALTAGSGVPATCQACPLSPCRVPFSGLQPLLIPTVEMENPDLSRKVQFKGDLP